MVVIISDVDIFLLISPSDIVGID